MKYIIGLFFLVLTILVLLSCNTVHKTSTTVKSNVDSTSVKQTDSFHVAKTDSTALSVENGEYVRESTYEFDTTIDLSGARPAVQYRPRLVKVVERGKYKRKEAIQKNGYDSSVSKTHDSARIISDIQTKDFKKDSSPFPIGLVLAGSVALALLIVFVFLMTKKQKQNEYQV